MTPSTSTPAAAAARPSAAWIAIALLAVYFLFLGGAANFQSSPQARVLTHLLVLGTVVAALAAAARGRLGAGTPLAVPALAWVGATVVAAVVSTRPEASLEAVALLLLAFPAYLVVRAAYWSEVLRPRIDWLLVAAATALVVLWLLQVAVQWTGWWSAVGPSMPPLRPGDVSLTLGTVNGVSLYLELLLPVAAWTSWVRWRRPAFTWALAALAIVAFLITGSRGAWLGGAAGAVVLAAMILRERGSSTLVHAVHRVPIAARIALLLAVSAVAVVAGPVLVTRLAGGDAGRLELWASAWSIFLDHPLFGAGPGAWQGLRALEPITAGHLVVLYNAHDSVLQVLVETGLVGLAAASWLVLATARLAWRSIASAPTLHERRLRQIAAASLVAAGVHSLFDTQFHLHGVVLLVFLLVATFDPPPRVGFRSRRERAPLAVAAVAVALGGLLLVPVDVAMIRAEIGNRALDAGRAADALAQFQAAVALHDLPVYRLGEAIARSRLDDVAGARRALERVVDREPYTFALASLGYAALRDGDRATAATMADAVARIGRYDPTATLAAAVIRWDLGDGPGAVSLLADVMVEVPSLIHSERPAALFDTRSWDEARGDALRELADIAPVRAAAAAIRAGLDDAAALAEAVPPGPEREMLALLEQAVRGGATDTTRAREIVRDDPGSLDVLELHWAIGFETASQAELDFVRLISVPQFFNVPAPPYEIVLDGAASADWSLRLARYPNAASSRLGPNRPYLAGMPTIEPVFRPR